MIRYAVKKPFTVSFTVWDGTSDADVVELMRGETVNARTPISRDGDCLLIHTLEGTMRANPGDVIIRGVHGELYPCKPEVFRATYEELES